MKKIVTSICMVAVVALAFTSCKKKENSQVFAFNHVTEQLVSDEGGLEKAYVDNNFTVQFEAGDKVYLFNVMNENGTGSSSGRYVVTSQMTLTPEIGEVGDHTDLNYYAFYPGENVTTHMSNENRATFRLDPTQTCTVDADGKPMIPAGTLYMAAKDETAQTVAQSFFNFKNIMGVLSLKFYSPSGRKVKSIAVTDKKFHLFGDVTLKIHEVDPIYMTTLFRNYSDTPEYLNELNAYKTRLGYEISGVTGSTVVLDCSQVPGGGVQLGQTAAEATRFFIVLRPLALLNGCDIEVTFDDDDVATISSSRDNRISPNVIKNISAVNIDTY
jgi:hypothetical protein